MLLVIVHHWPLKMIWGIITTLTTHNHLRAPVYPCWQCLLHKYTIGWHCCWSTALGTHLLFTGHVDLINFEEILMGRTAVQLLTLSNEYIQRILLWLSYLIDRCLGCSYEWMDVLSFTSILSNNKQHTVKGKRYSTTDFLWNPLH